MTDVNKLLNGTKAGFIARQLDAKDGQQDGKIKASIWNEFVKEIGTGKEINEFISTESAMKSITTYLFRKKEADKSVNELAQEWSDKIDNASSVKPAGETATAVEVENGEEVDNTGEVVNNEEVEKPKETGAVLTEQQRAEQIEKDFKSMKVDAFAEIKPLLDARKKGKEIANGMKSLPNPAIQEKLQTEVNKDNIAYVLNNFPQILNLGYNRKVLRKYVLTPLLEKANEYGISDKTIDDYASMKIEELKSEILKLKNAIIRKDNERINDIKSAQKTFDNANKFLAEVANMNPKPQVIEKKHESNIAKSVHLEDGRWIGIRLFNNGSIYINISHDITKDSDGNEYCEVSYQLDANNNPNATYDYDKSNHSSEGWIWSGFDFEEIKTVAEKIFGEIKPLEQN